MKLNCSKCNYPLTTDLRPSKKDKAYDSVSAPSFSHSQWWLKKGVFYVKKACKYNWGYEESGIEGYFAVIHEPEAIVVAPESVLPDLLSGERKGCCSFPIGKKIGCPQCSQELASLHIDCICTGEVMFHSKAVNRVYR